MTIWIDTADDAGVADDAGLLTNISSVLRVREDLEILHTTTAPLLLCR